MTQLSCPFIMGQSVRILAIDTPGIVRSIRIDTSAMTFLVTYWWEGHCREAWLTEVELTTP